MAGNEKSKLKTLKIIEILNKYSDENHPMSAADICAELSKEDIHAERKSIYSDIDVLRSYGYDIISTSTPKKGVYMGERDFELVEVRLLIDAVQSAKFITEKKTEVLVDKIEKNLSKWHIEDLSGQVYVDNRNKNENETVYYTIDTLSTAIRSEKKVSIHYIKRRIEAGERPKNEEHIYTVSPYALIWADDHYYLICNNAKYNNPMHLRIDKIKSVRILADGARPRTEIPDFAMYKDHFDVADYASKTFNMFSGELEKVEIRCANTLWDVVRDRFGEDVRVLSRTDDNFTISVTVAAGDGFASWILQYGADMVVVSPNELKDKVLTKARETVIAYEKEVAK